MDREAPGYDATGKHQAIIGLDIARFGDDKSVVFTRVGRDARSIEPREYIGLDGHDLGREVVSHAMYLLEVLGFSKVYIFYDRAGVGAAVSDYFRHFLADPRVVTRGVDFGEKAANSKLYLNKRVEMWGLGKEWIAKEGALPKNEQLKTELIAPLYQFTEKQQFQLERKKDLKSRIGCSPDHADALMLTFAEPYAEVSTAVRDRNQKRASLSRRIDPFRALEPERERRSHRYALR